MSIWLFQYLHGGRQEGREWLLSKHQSDTLGTNKRGKKAFHLEFLELQNSREFSKRQLCYSKRIR